MFSNLKVYIKKFLFLSQDPVRSIRLVLGNRLEEAVGKSQFISHALLRCYGLQHRRCNVWRGYFLWFLRFRDSYGLDNLLSGLPLDKIISKVKTKFRNYSPALVLSDFCSAIATFILLGVVFAHSGTGLKLESPAVVEPPGTSKEKTDSQPVSFQTAVFGLLVHSERELNGSNIVMGIYQIQSKEPFLVNLLRPDAEFRNRQKVLPLLLLHLVIVPGKETRPRLEAKVAAQANMLGNRDFQAKIRSTATCIKEVGTDRCPMSPSSVGIL